MAVLVVQQWEPSPQVTEVKYWEVTDELELRDSLPEGCAYHAAGGDEALGYVVTEIWATPESFQEFAQNRLGPVSIRLGLPTPTVTMVPLVREQRVL